MESDLISETRLLGRLVLAAALTSLIGWERERNRRPAGLRTHALVGVSAALFTGLAEAFTEYYRAREGVHVDPLRTLEALVAGISFLGAGTVFTSKGNVQGLTTAASLLAAGGVGMAVGLSRYVLAVGSTTLLFAVLVLLAQLPVEKKEESDSS